MPIFRKQHSFLIVLFFTVLFFVIFPKTGIAQVSSTTFPALIYDNFDSYTLGTIDGQGNWVVDSQPTRITVNYTQQLQVSFPYALKDIGGNSFHATSTTALGEGTQFFWIAFTKNDIGYTADPVAFFSATYQVLFSFYLARTGDYEYCLMMTPENVCVSDRRFVASTNPVVWYPIGIYWNNYLGIVRYYDGEWTSDHAIGLIGTPTMFFYGSNSDKGIFMDNFTDNSLFPITTGVSTTTSSATLKQRAYDGCNQWIFPSNYICSALVYLFLPDYFYLSQFIVLKDAMLNKPPFSYVVDTFTAFGGLNASSTPAFALSAIGAIQTVIFDNLDIGIAGVIWLFFALWLIKRIGDFVP